MKRQPWIVYFGVVLLSIGILACVFADFSPKSLVTLLIGIGLIVFGAYEDQIKHGHQESELDRKLAEREREIARREKQMELDSRERELLRKFETQDNR